MNQAPNRPQRPAAPTAARPGVRGAQKRRQRRLRPAALAVLVLMMLLVSVIVFLLTYQIVYRAELARLQNSSTEEHVSVPDEKNPSETSSEDSTVLFTSPATAAAYVDGLGADCSDLDGFSVSRYFPDCIPAETADAGDSYQNETVYIGDSLVLHMKSDFSHPTALVYGAESITPEDACVKKLAKKKSGAEATFAEAMEELAPKRIVISIGTNSTWMEGKDYLQFFSRFLDQLKAASPESQLILQTIPPVTAEYEADKSYPTNEKINRFNLYLAALATYHEIPLLDSAPGLKNAGGTLDEAYSAEDGFHLNEKGYTVWISYLRTHALNLQG